MTTHTGEEGIVQVDANTMLEVRSFTFDEGIEVYDDSAKGDAWKTHLNGKKEWSGSIDCWWSSDDTTGQDVLVVGATVAVILLPEGNTSTDVKYSGNVTVTGVSRTSPESGTTEASFTFQGNGALTKGAVA